VRGCFDVRLPGGSNDQLGPGAPRAAIVACGTSSGVASLAMSMAPAAGTDDIGQTPRKLLYGERNT
jgi:hypothetical protein